MTYFTPTQLEKLFANGQPDKTGKDHWPIALLFFPKQTDIRHHFLLTELYEDRPFIGYGLSSVAGRRPVVQEIVLSFLLNRDDCEGFGTRHGGVAFDSEFEAEFPLSNYLKICYDLTFWDYKGDSNELMIPYINYYSKSLYPLTRNVPT